jgi:hypothetical protein
MAIKVRFEPIRAKIPDINDIYREITGEMNRIGQETQTVYASFFQTWDSRPVSAYRVTTERGQGTIYVDNYPQADEGLRRIIHWMIYGTEPHPIDARGDQPMIFPHGELFVPKTAPGVIQSGPGREGGHLVSAWSVEHPGTEPRNTLETIDKQREARVHTQLREAFNRGLMKARRRAR